MVDTASAGEEVCAGCGLLVAGGAEGCLELYQERMGIPLGVSAHIGFGRMAWDTYCVQHPDVYCVSAKSLVAHLGGLCWAIEYSGHPTGYQALNRWLSGTPALRKPAIPAARGTLTIADVRGIADAAHVRTVERWAHAAWDAYSTLHPLAREWLETALAGR